MGTRINALLKHDLPDHRDRESVLRRLSPTLPAMIAVDEYWRTADPETPSSGRKEWTAERESPRDDGQQRYSAPGSLFLTLGANAAWIRGGGRWRGLLTIEPLRRVHFAAFRQIAAALGSTQMALYADSCEVDDLFWRGQTFENCVRALAAMRGSPRGSLADFNGEIIVKDSNVFAVWYLIDS